MKRILFLSGFIFFTVFSVLANEIPCDDRVVVLKLKDFSSFSTEEVEALLYRKFLLAFAESGKYSVSALEISLTAEEVQDFIDGIKEPRDAVFYKYYTEEILEASVLVIPVLVDYHSNETTAGVEAGIEISFFLLNPSDGEILDSFTLAAYGMGTESWEADADAADALCRQLQFRLRSMGNFKFESSISEVIGFDVIIDTELFPELKVGDEFYIREAFTSSDGSVGIEQVGLLVVSDIEEDSVFGHIIYKDRRVEPGMALVENSRFGFEIIPSGKLFIDSTGITGGSVGVRMLLSRRFFHIRPFAGIEVPFVTENLDGTWPGFPVSIIAGGELIWYFGRLQIEPSISVGLTGLLPMSDEESFQISHLGLSVGVTLNWLLFDNIKLFIDGGYNPWLSLSVESDSTITNFGGAYAGLGVTFKL